MCEIQLTLREKFITLNTLKEENSQFSYITTCFKNLDKEVQKKFTVSKRQEIIDTGNRRN